MNQNTFSGVGRLAANPMVKSYTRKSDGAAGTRCFMRLAVTRKMDRSKKIGDPDRRTNFIPLVAWGKRGELCAQYLAQGTMIAVTGEVIAESQVITDNGQKDGTPVLDANGRKQYRDFFYIQVEDVQFGPRSLKNSTPERLQTELARVQTAINAASAGDTATETESDSAPETAPDADENPYSVEGETA
jgi:single-strand DNA-binding protein